LIGASDTGTGNAPGGDPVVKIVYPPSNSVVPMTLTAPPAECRLQVTVAIDVDDFELVSPAETDGDVDGQGHLHLQVLDRGYAVISDQYSELDEDGLAPGDIVTITATLQSNSHLDLDMFAGWRSTIEVTLGEPEGAVSCP